MLTQDENRNRQKNIRYKSVDRSKQNKNQYVKNNLTDMSKKFINFVVRDPKSVARSVMNHKRCQIKKTKAGEGKIMVK